jgi:hypothetical protein
MTGELKLDVINRVAPAKRPSPAGHFPDDSSALIVGPSETPTSLLEIGVALDLCDELLQCLPVLGGITIATDRFNELLCLLRPDTLARRIGPGIGRRKPTSPDRVPDRLGMLKQFPISSQCHETSFASEVDCRPPPDDLSY